MTETKKLTKEEAVKLAVAAAQESEKHSQERRVALAELLKPGTGGEVQLPKANLNGIALIEQELGSLGSIDLGRVANLRAIIWALLNQDSGRAFGLSEEQRREELIEVGKHLRLDQIQGYADAITEALGVTEARPPKPSRRRTKR